MLSKFLVIRGGGTLYSSPNQHEDGYPRVAYTIKDRIFRFSDPLGVHLAIIPSGDRLGNDIVLVRVHFLVEDWCRGKAEPGLSSRIMAATTEK